MAGKLRQRFRGIDQALTAQPDHALVGVLRIPENAASPWRAIGKRILIAVGTLFAAVLVVYADRGGYRDVASTPEESDPLSFLDCFYYATVSLSTTGYGDITPYTEGARLVNILVITPLRLLFLIVLVGTTVEALTERSRQALKIQRWRARVRNHTVVVGYGTKGKTAVQAMLSDGAAPSEIVVVDEDQMALDAAAAADLVTVRGSATKSDVLRLAGVQNAKSIIVAANRDDTSVLVTLTARELAPTPRSWPRSARRRMCICCASPVPTRSWCPRNRGTASRHRHHDTAGRRDDRGLADSGGGIRDRGTRGGAQRGRRLTAPSVRHRAGGGARRHPAPGRRPRGRFHRGNRPPALRPQRRSLI